MVVNKKLISSLIILFLVAAFLTGCGKSATSSSTGKKVYKIGITQIVEHPALDAAKKGFIDALSAKGFKDGTNIKIDFQNAQGDMPTAQTIAKNFASDKKDLILAIATPSAQAAYNATKDIPILITAVTDPQASGLVKSWDKPQTNVTGTSDATPVEKQFELLKKLLPAAKKVGIIYNTSEANSQIQVNKAKSIAKNYGLEIVESGITSTNDIPQTLGILLKKVDVLYTPTDNMIASSISIIISKCMQDKIPLISGEDSPVKQGALATEGIDYYKLGYETGLMAVDVLNGKKPSDMAIQTLKDTKLIINKDTAQKLGISIPDDLKSRAELVTGGVTK